MSILIWPSTTALVEFGVASRRVAVFVSSGPFPRDFFERFGKSSALRFLAMVWSIAGY